MGKLNDDSPLPTIEVGRANGPIHYTEKVVDWRRVAIVDGRKVVVDRQLTDEEVLAGGVPGDATIVDELGEVSERLRGAD